MKKQAIIFIIACVVLVLSSYNYNCLSTDLIQAVQDKKVNVVVASTGGHSGKCMQLKITNLTTVPLYLEIAAGTIFLPDDEGEQTILVPQKSLFVLQKSETKMLAVSGYCTELSDRCPQSTSSFKIAKNSNQHLMELVQVFAPLTKLDEGLIQQSIWCLTDGADISNVSGTDAVATKAVRDFLLKKTGQADTWYSTKRTPVVTADRSIQNNAIEIVGKVEIKALKPMELIGVVKNEAGEIVWKYPYRTSLPKGDIVFDFNLKVTGWKSGNYYMIYTCEGVELVNQKFTI